MTKDVRYAYPAEVQGGKDCNIGLTLRASPGEAKSTPPEAIGGGRINADENGRLVFTFDNTYSCYDKIIVVNINPRDWPRPKDRGVHMSYICRGTAGIHSRQPLD